MNITVGILTILACVILNRFSGTTGWMGKDEDVGDTRGWFPGRPIFYTAPVLGLIAYASQTWDVAVLIAATYFLWRLPAWGRWFTLGRSPRRGAVNQYERVIERVAGSSDHIAFGIRQFAIAPGVAALAYWTGDPWTLLFIPIAVAGIVSAYEVGWRLSPKAPIFAAELITGALWGALILGV